MFSKGDDGPRRSNQVDGPRRSNRVGEDDDLKKEEANQPSADQLTYKVYKSTSSRLGQRYKSRDREEALYSSRLYSL